MRISKRVYWVLFVYILAFLADGVLTNHFSKLFLFSGYSLTASNDYYRSRVVKLHD